MSKAFDKTIMKKCEYCAFGESLGESMLCKKHGITEKTDVCRKYKYDPLKRQPLRKNVSGDFSEKDFEL